jgi:hypothetical protein
MAIIAPNINLFEGVSMCINSRTMLVTVILGSFCIWLVSCSDKKNTSNTPAVVPYTNSAPAPAQFAGSPFPQSNGQPNPTATNVIGEPGKLQSVDIFSGKPINRGVFGDYSGQRVYFCCPTSKATFDANSQAHLEAIKARGIILEKNQ